MDKLPAELWNMIFDVLEEEDEGTGPKGAALVRQDDLLKLSQVSKFFYAVATPRLYQELYDCNADSLASDDESSTSKQDEQEEQEEVLRSRYHGIICSLLQHEHLAQHLTTMWLEIRYVGRERLYTRSGRPRRQEGHEAIEREFAKTVQLLTSCARLQRLTLRYDPQNPFDEKDPSIQFTPGSDAFDFVLPSLKELHLQPTIYRDRYPPISTFVAKQENLVKLSVTNCEYVLHDAAKLSQLKEVDVTFLDFRPDLDTSKLQQFLSNSKANIESFSVEGTVTASDFVKIWTPYTGSNLDFPSSRSLRHLALSCTDTRGQANYGPDRVDPICFALQANPALVSLGLSFWTSRKAQLVADVCFILQSPTLPKTLRKINIHIGFDNDILQPALDVASTIPGLKMTVSNSKDS